VPVDTPADVPADAPANAVEASDTGERAPAAAPEAAPIRCAICGTLVRDTEEVTSCPECRQDYHAACWDEIGGCATYGCKSAAVAEKPPPPENVGGGWGDEKECPSCGQTIASSLLVCLCGARFPWADPMTREEYSAWRAREESLASSRKVLTALFLMSLAGFLAPLAGPIAGFYAFRQRKKLMGANGVYLAIGYGSAALGVTYVAAGIILTFAW
jgi:hypothetical protein